jgi:transcription elongation factor Elf1
MGMQPIHQYSSIIDLYVEIKRSVEKVSDQNGSHISSKLKQKQLFEGNREYFADFVSITKL